MAKTKTSWLPAARKTARPAVKDSTKRLVTDKANELIASVLKPRHIKPPPTDNNFNYLIDISSKWYRQFFYFVATYHCPGPHAISPTFDTKFARLEWIGPDQFNLSFMRHNNEWFEVSSMLTLDDCLQQIAESPEFIP